MEARPWWGGVEINGTVFAGGGWDSNDKLAESGRGPTPGYSLPRTGGDRGQGGRDTLALTAPETIEDQPHGGH